VEKSTQFKIDSLLNCKIDNELGGQLLDHSEVNI